MWPCKITHFQSKITHFQSKVAPSTTTFFGLDADADSGSSFNGFCSSTSDCWAASSASCLCAAVPTSSNV